MVMKKLKYIKANYITKDLYKGYSTSKIVPKTQSSIITKAVNANKDRTYALDISDQQRNFCTPSELYIDHEYNTVLTRTVNLIVAMPNDSNPKNDHHLTQNYQ